MSQSAPHISSPNDEVPYEDRTEFECWIDFVATGRLCRSAGTSAVPGPGPGAEQGCAGPGSSAGTSPGKDGAGRHGLPDLFVSTEHRSVGPLQRLLWPWTGVSDGCGVPGILSGGPQD